MKTNDYLQIDKNKFATMEITFKRLLKMIFPYLFQFKCDTYLTFN